MIDGTFDVAVDTPKLHRRGTVTLKSDGGAIAGTMNVGEVEGVALSGTCADKEFTISGSAEFGDAGMVEFKALGSVWGNSLDVKAETSLGDVTVFGTRIGSAAGVAASSHDYVMSASEGNIFGGDATMYSGLYADGA